MDRPPRDSQGYGRFAFREALHETYGAWGALTAYERFEQIAVLILTGLISIVIVASVVQLAFRIVWLLLVGLVDPADQNLFQAIFGMIMTVLIALEFNHSLLGVLERKHSIIQVKTVVLIALLALVRKFMIIDATKIDPLAIIGLAAAVLALGAVYLLLRGQDQRRPVAASSENAAMQP